MRKTCYYCKKEKNINNGTEMCHECAIIKSMKNISDKELYYFKNHSAELEVGSYHEFEKLDKNIVRHDTKIKFHCEQCSTECKVRIERLENKDKLLCHDCAIKYSIQQKYGVDNVFRTDDIKQKIKETNMKRYGVDCYLKTKEARTLRAKSQFDEAVEKIASILNGFSTFEMLDNRIRPNLDKFKGGKETFAKIACTCLKCGKNYETNARRVQRCPDCYSCDWSNGTSKSEKEIVDYISSIYDGNIIENDRRILYPKELDIYLPELKLAIEFDGDYYHGASSREYFQEMKKVATYKQTKCYKLGIHLITIKECEFLKDKEKFFKLLKRVIKPRTVELNKCKIQKINENQFKIFFNKEQIAEVFIKKRILSYSYYSDFVILDFLKSFKNYYKKPFIYYKNLKYEFGKRNTPVSYFLSKNYNILQLKDFSKEQCYSKSKEFYENVFENKFTIIFDCGFEKLSF